MSGNKTARHPVRWRTDEIAYLRQAIAGGRPTGAALASGLLAACGTRRTAATVNTLLRKWQQQGPLQDAPRPPAPPPDMAARRLQSARLPRPDLADHRALVQHVIERVFPWELSA